MKVEKLKNGYRLRLNDSEFAALSTMVKLSLPNLLNDRKRLTTEEKRGLNSFENGLKVTADRRTDSAEEAV